jgi:deoxyadenosine/deoxycytidine kinase
MERDYIASLSRTYDQFFAHYAAAPVLKIATDRLDIVHSPQDLNHIIECIRRELDAAVFQQPLL